jgi:hypothetical protein
MTTKQILTWAMALSALNFAACDKGEDTAEEVITTIEVHMTGSGGFDQKFYWDDTDGDGVANSIDTIKLPANVANLFCHMHVYDRSQTPELDITEEIEEENTEHLFVYRVDGSLNLTIGSLNTDSAGDPFGITSVWATGGADNGVLNIQLYHEPTDKSNANSPGGEVDFDVLFPVSIK